MVWLPFVAGCSESIPTIRTPCERKYQRFMDIIEECPQLAKKTTKVQSSRPETTATSSRKGAAKSESKTTGTGSQPSNGKARGSDRKSAVSKHKVEEAVVNWYDHPEWYELGFLKETPKEAKFLEAVFKKHVKFPVTRVLEVGCGSGRLVREMARRGYETTGLDLNSEALKYCKKKLQEDGCSADLVKGDMTDFWFGKPFDAAFNAINTFRHLETEEAAVKHLECIASNLQTGGVFVLSLHLIPHDGDLWGTERWSAKGDGVAIRYALTVLDCDVETRIERLRITMNVEQDGKVSRLSDEIRLRLYNVDQLKSLLAKMKQFELVGVYDFWFDIQQRQRLSRNSCDTVLVLKKL